MVAKGHGNEHKAELEHIVVLNVRRLPSNPLVRVISSCLEHLRERRREAAGRMVQLLEQNPLEFTTAKTLTTFTKKKEVPRSEIQETLDTVARHRRTPL